MDLGLEGKSALIAGGGRGIGKAIALSLASEGVNIAIASRTLSQLESTADEIQDKTGSKVIPLAFDVTDNAQVVDTIKKAALKLGNLNILVNSASLPVGSPSAIGPIETVNENALLRDFEIKYVGALRCSRAAIPYLKQEKWGRIINISGMNARKAGNLSGGARNTSMVHLTKTLAMQLGQYGITVNCIHPGVTRTERTIGLMDQRAKELKISPEEVEELDYATNSSSGNFIGRMIEASEIAHIATFLSSDKAWAITGELVGADGGTGDSVYY